MAVTVKAAVSEMRQCERCGISVSTVHRNLLALWSGNIKRDDEGSSWYISTAVHDVQKRP
jgi:DNA-binding IclR family transcriptional regulator